MNAACLLAAACLPQATVGIETVMPRMFVEGEPFVVSIELSAPGEAGVGFPAWMLAPGGFTMNGRPLARRENESLLRLQPGGELVLSYDLGPALEAAENFDRKDFRLGYGPDRGLTPTEVTFLEAAEKGIDFLALPQEQLDDYDVVLRTGRGSIWIHPWAEIAPNHVRNFLDLAYTGFYDGTTFHRVIPSFMIQGGRAKAGSKAPRTVVAEFSTRRHVPGVVSAARLAHDINSASSEFFIVHGVSPTLDGQYSPFGQVVEGMDAVDRIAQSYDPRFPIDDERAHVPPVDQVIEKAVVVRAPKLRPETTQR
jgi:cyclophilin family peptidyl-prolyl cis-trans isomerase